MAKYRKKPVEIEAMQFIGTNANEILEFLKTSARPIERKRGVTNPQVNESEIKILIKTLEGTMEASSCDWIIKGVNGEFYPCKPDIFAKTYEAV